MWSTPHLSSLLPGKTRYPLYRRVGGPQGWSGWVQKMLSPLWFDTRIIQPVVSCYTDYAIPAHNTIMHTCQSMYRINNNQNVVIITNVCTIIFLVMVSVNTVGKWDTDPLHKVFRMVLQRIQILWDVIMFHWVSGTTPHNTVTSQNTWILIYSVSSLWNLWKFIH